MRDPNNSTTKNRYKISSQIYLEKTRLLYLLQPILHPPLTKLLLLQKLHQLLFPKFIHLNLPNINFLNLGFFKYFPRYKMIK